METATDSCARFEVGDMDFLADADGDGIGVAAPPVPEPRRGAVRKPPWLSNRILEE